MNEVAQSAITILLHRPDDARARPGNYLGGSGKQIGEKHKLLFRPRKSSKALELSAYLTCVHIVRKVEDFLGGMASVDYSDRRNILFYIAYYSVCRICGTSEPSVEDVCQIKSSDMSQELLQESFKNVNGMYLQLGKEEENRDVVAKGTELLAMIKRQLPQTPTQDRSKTEAKMKIKDILLKAEFQW